MNQAIWQLCKLMFDKQKVPDEGRNNEDLDVTEDVSIKYSSYQ